jgi:hypothetical protein
MAMKMADRLYNAVIKQLDSGMVCSIIPVSFYYLCGNFSLLMPY